MMEDEVQFKLGTCIQYSSALFSAAWGSSSGLWSTKQPSDHDTEEGTPQSKFGKQDRIQAFSCIFKYFQREIGLVPKPLRQIYEVFFNIFFVVVSIALTPFRTLYFKRIKSCHGCNGFSWRKMPAVSDLCLSKSTITLLDSLNGGTGISL